MGKTLTKADCIRPSDLLPPRPFQAVCVDNDGRDDLMLGQTYTILSSYGGDSDRAYTDFDVYGVTASCSIGRFALLSATTRSPTLDQVDRQDLPSSHFQVECVNGIPEEKLERGNIYTVVGFRGIEFILKELPNYSYSRRRFIMAGGKDSSHTSEDNGSEWRVWANQGRQPHECPCRIPRELCHFHR